MGKKFKKVVVGVVLIIAAIYTWGGALGTLFLNAGISTLASVVLAATAKRPGTPPVNITLRGTVEFRRMVFGTRRCGGVLVFYGTSGTESKYLWYVIAYAGHQSNAFSDFWIDERRVASAGIPGGGGGTVSASPWNSKLTIWKHLGTGAQTVDTNLDAAFTTWTSNHKLLGTTYAVIRFERDADVFPDVPGSVSCLVDGALLYDPRLDSTNGGSGSQRKTDPSTWVFSRNPALMIRWYLTGGSVDNNTSTRLIKYGCGEIDSRIEESYVIAAANVCDETLSGSVAPPSGSQTRYLCDLEVHCGETRREIIGAILATFAGTLTPVHGKWRVYAGAYNSPVHTITDADLYGDLEVQDTIGHDARYNAVAPIFFDAASQYVQTTGIYRTDSAYETQDGGERIPTELQLDGVTSGEQAQRLAEIHLRKSRMMCSIKQVGALNLLRMATHETQVFTHPRLEWTNRVFRVNERQFDLTEEAGRVIVLAQREDSGVWADPLTADYTSGTSNTDVFQSDGPDSPTNLTATSRPLGIEFEVTAPSYLEAGSRVELWEYTSSTPFGSATRVVNAAATRFFLPKTDTTTRYYWTRIRAPNGAVSGTYPASTGLAGVANPVQTEDIEPGAATGIITDHVAGPADENTGVRLRVQEVQVPALDVDSIVEVVVSIYMMNEGLGGGAFLSYTPTSGPGQNGSTVDMRSVPFDANNSDIFIPYTLHFEQAFNAGDSPWMEVYIQGYAPLSGRITVRELNMRIEVIKR